MTDSNKQMSEYERSEIGQVANAYAARNIIQDHLSRRADNTVRAYFAALDRFAEYLHYIDFPVGNLKLDVEAWRGMTWGIVEGFRLWMIKQGDAVSTINLRLTAVRLYSMLAARAGVISEEDAIMIKSVSGYNETEARRVDERRPVTRRGWKKAESVSLTYGQASLLKMQPDTPQGRRDALLMCLLLDHGLRCGEVAGLKVGDFDIGAGVLKFYRPKVDKVQTHKLSADTLRALSAWASGGDMPADKESPVLRGSRKGGELTEPGMSTASITARVRALGKAISIPNLSAHDCRHYWATYWAGKIDVFRLREAGGWNSLNVVLSYVKEAEIANDGMA